MTCEPPFTWTGCPLGGQGTTWRAGPEGTGLSRGEAGSRCCGRCSCRCRCRSDRRSPRRAGRGVRRNAPGREPTSDTERQVDVGEDRTAHAGAVEGQRATEDVRVHPSDRLEQREMRSEHLVLECQPEQHRCSRVALLVHRVSQTGTNRPAAFVSATTAAATSSHPSSSPGSGLRPAITSWRKLAEFSVTPRKHEPPPSEAPAAIAPWSESGALRYVTRAAIAVGVNP